MQKGRLDFAGFFGVLRVYLRFILALVNASPRVVYLLLASNKIAFLRDVCFILTARVIGRRVVAHYRGGNFAGFYRNQSRLMQWIVRQTLRRTDRVIVQARLLKPMFQGILPANRIEVLYNALPVAPTGRGGIARPKNEVEIFFMGHLTFAKGFYDLMQSHKTLVNEFPCLRLGFAGERASAGAVQQIADFLNGEHKTRYLQRATEIHDEIDEFIRRARNYGATYHGVVDSKRKLEIFSQSDIFVLPSYTEGFSLSVLEAMLMGLPVVVTAVGANPEIIEDGYNGFVIEPGDTDALAEKLETLIESPELRKEMGERNARSAREKFSLEAITEDLAKIFDKTNGNGHTDKSQSSCAIE